jgi:HSP20 family protein
MFGLLPWKKKTSEAKVPVSSQEDFFQPLARLREEFDRLLERFFGRMPVPAEEEEFFRWGGLDFNETDKEYVVRMDAPGFEPNEFDVQLSGNRLIVRAEKKVERKKEAGGRTIEEAGYRSFYRTVTLPNAVDPNRVEGKYHNGVLEIHVGKSPEAKGRKVPIKAG